MWGGDGRLLWVLLLLLAAAEGVLCNSDAIDCTPYKGIKGEDITLPPNVTGTLSEIIWKKEVNKKFDKVAEWDDALKLYSHLLNRALIDPVSGNLTIRNISQIDDGKYRADALVNISYQLSYLCLKTFEPPPVPNLTCSIDDDNICVHCTSVTGYELPLSYRWNYINMNDTSIVNSTEEHSIVKLRKTTDLSRNITCTIVASKSTVSNTISLMTCDLRGTGAASQERTITIPIVLVIIFGLIVAVLLIWWKRKGWPSFTFHHGSHLLHSDPVLPQKDIPERQGEIMPFLEGGPENELAQTSNIEEIPERHQGETTPFPEGGPENELAQTSSIEVNPESHTNESGPSDEQLSEPEHKKTSSIEVNPESHTNESGPSDEQLSEPEHKKTSSIEDMTTPES